MGQDGAMVVAVLAAMPSELQPFVRAAGLQRQGEVYAGTLAGHDIVARTMGVGMTGASRAAEQAIAGDDGDDAGAVERVVVIGIAGGIGPALPVGHVLVPEVVVDGATGVEHRPAPWGPAEPAGRLVTFDDFDVEMTLMADLERQGYAAVDMETAAVAAVCERHGCPCTVFRAISDRTSDGLVDADIAAMARPDGTPDLRAVLRYVLRRPWRIPRLARLGRDSRTAAHAAADAAIAALRYSA